MAGRGVCSPGSLGLVGPGKSAPSVSVDASATWVIVGTRHHVLSPYMKAEGTEARGGTQLGQG